MKLQEFNEMMKDSFGDRVVNIPSKTDNQLIAEFMGLEYAPKNKRWNDWFDKNGIRVTYGNRIPLQYHTSWDWLMSVVKKCFCTGDNTFEWDAIMDAMWTCDIKIVHNVVVEFINQHNKI